MNQTTKSNLKRPYSQPKLIQYGTVQEMTLGGVFPFPIGSNGQCPPDTTDIGNGICVLLIDTS